MADITPETLDKLKAAGVNISDETYSTARSRMPSSVEPQQPVKLEPISVQEEAPRVPQIDPLDIAQAQSINNMGSAYGTQKAALYGLQDAAKQKGAEEAVAYRDMASEQTKLANEQAKLELERQQEYNKGLEEVDKVQKEAANYKVDTNRLWNSFNTAQKIGLGIAAILGGLDSKGNQAADLISKAIDKDNADQVKEYEMLKEKGKQAQSVFADKMEQYKDKRLALIATSMTKQEALKSELLRAGAKYTSAEAAGKFKMALGELNNQIEKNKQEMIKGLQERRAYDALYGTADAGASPDSQRINRMLSVMKPEDREKFQEKRVTGKGYDFAARTKERAKGLSDLGVEADSALTLIDQLKAQDGESLPLTERRMKAQSIQKALAGMLRVPITGPGAMTKDEYDRLLELVPNPTEITTFNGVARLSELQNILRTKLKTAVEAEGGKYYGDVGFSTQRVK
jgi:hypothetical protein